jgi:polysaccharide biosynthesis protein PelE
MAAEFTSSAQPEAGPDTTAVAGWRTPRRETVAALFAFVAELLVIILVVTSRIAVPNALQLHAFVAAITAGILFYDRRDGEDLTIAALITLVVAASGPAGAAAALAAVTFVKHAGAGPDVLDAWYARLSNASGADLSTVLTDRVLAGRVIDTEAVTPTHFEDVIANGSLSERQAALGLIARHFHTDFTAALEQALRSPEPVVRVQAAAVVARVRADLKTRVKFLLSNNPVVKPARTLAYAAELARLSQCSLVDRAEAELCRKAAAEKLNAALTGSRAAHAASAVADGEAAALIERYLLRESRFADFRSARRIHAVVSGGSYRVRRINKDVISKGPISKEMAAS